MTGIVWAAILGGLAIVVHAVGIPYFLTHKRMRSPHDHAESHEYLQKTRRRVRQDGAISARLGRPPQDQGASQPSPAGDSGAAGQTAHDPGAPG